jgi:hypothetical protein
MPAVRWQVPVTLVVIPVLGAVQALIQGRKEKSKTGNSLVLIDRLAVQRQKHLLRPEPPG